MATARLRKTFHYPAEGDDDSDEPAEGIDEEEQEKLITSLHAQDAAKTAFYSKAFLTLPFLSTLIYLPSLLRPSSPYALLSSILSVSSLLSTAYILYAIPPRPAHNPSGFARPSRYALSDSIEAGPLKKYIVYADAALCGVLALRAWLLGSTLGREHVWLGALPAVMFGLIMFVRAQLRPVDVTELERLRYEYKGA